MTTFEDREKSFEAKYRRDQELQFKVNARRNKLLGLWAAEKLGLDAASAETYAKEVVMADFDEPGEEDVVRKVMADFGAKSLAIEEHTVRHEMDRLLAVAKEQIQKET